MKETFACDVVLDFASYLEIFDAGVEEYANVTAWVMVSFSSSLVLE